jgi:hypothetical protein
MITARTFFTVLILLVVAGLGIAGIYFASRTPQEVPAVATPEILSFEDCAIAGYPVMESFPRRCATPDGRIYAEELPAPEPTYVNASADVIRVSNPTPGAVVGKPIMVMGEARGTWYFEASFPIEVRDASGAIIATGIGQPVNGADWMTEEFVPFSATIEIPEDFIGEATLTLMNDNPSGMPENARSVSFPLTIEY